MLRRWYGFLRMQGRVARDPSDVRALSQLGIAYLQKARETNDPSFYTQADEALNKALSLEPNDYDSVAALGSLELSRHMFAEADHDSGALARLLESDAVAGCFCQGELGPVGGRTFVHGFTATVAVFA